MAPALALIADRLARFPTVPRLRSADKDKCPGETPRAGHRGYMSRVLRLTLLAPGLVAAILDGR
jgi:hypothetical protein